MKKSFICSSCLASADGYILPLTFVQVLSRLCILCEFNHISHIIMEATMFRYSGAFFNDMENRNPAMCL